jgi:D-glycero-alpha-D-manno-heptose-7-phosphate kinase
MIISRAPVRLSLGGGGTDLASFYTKHGGFLIAGAINKYVYININKRFNTPIRLSYSKTEIVDDVNKIEHNIFREALKMTGIESQIDIASIADVPAQSGLGTSSTFTVALLNGLSVFRREYLSLNDLAEKACRIEIDILKKPIGKQDQFVASYGGFNAYTFNADGSVVVEPVDISAGKVVELQNNIVLFYVGKERSAEQVLSDQDSKSLEGDKGTLDTLLKIKDMGYRSKEIFETGKVDEFGELLHEHWTTKKKLSDKISEPFIDEIYDEARKNGALGGKIVGAGGGGFLLLYCPQNKDKLVRSMRKFNLEPTWVAFEKEGAQIVYHD